MNQNYTEEQIQAMIEKIKQVKPEAATRERAIKILNMLPEVADDITKALQHLVKSQRKNHLQIKK